MAFYDFEATDGSGRATTVEAPMSKGIPIGERRVIGGVEYRRVPPRRMQVAPCPPEHFVSRSLPKSAAQYTRNSVNGRPALETKHEARELAKRLSENNPHEEIRYE